MIKCPLKIILFGEHSILKGGRCLLVTINKFAIINEIKDTCVVQIRDNKDFFLYVSIEDNMLIINPTDQSNCSSIVVDSYFGSGLGTSASICLLLSFLKSKSEIDKKVLTVDDAVECLECIKNRAIEYEHIFHGLSSGADVNGCFYGGCVNFNDKKSETFPIDWINKYKLIVFDSEISKNTKDIISSPINNVEFNLDQLKGVADRAYELLIRSFNLKEMYLLIREAQDILEDMDLVPDKMKSEVVKLRKMGIESKIAGGGRGGHLFTFVERDTVIKGWEEIEINPIGFKLEFLDHLIKSN